MSLEGMDLDCALRRGGSDREDDDGDDGRPANDRHTPPSAVDLHDDNAVDECLLLALPDELLLGVFSALSDAEVPARAASVARRLAALSRDDTLWQSLYVRRYGPSVHKHFAEFGKDWRWLYRARSRRADAAPAEGPGCVAMTKMGHFYCGDLDGGVPHGYGLHVYVECLTRARDVDPRDAFALASASGGSRTEEGQWARGKKHGRTIEADDGDRYDGEYVDGIRQGQGTYVWRSGSVYRGAYVDCRRSGWGVMNHADGRRYEGHWTRGRRDGEGTMTLPDGRSYSGHWANTNPHGWGVHTWPNGNRVEASWKRGAPRGEGALISPDGRVFFDRAKELFCVGGATIPDDGSLPGSDGWDSRLKRMRYVPCESDAHRRTVDTLYVDGSRLSVFWHRGNHGRSYRVAAHSPVCRALGRSAAKEEEAPKEGAAVGTCMACLCVACTPEGDQARWYLGAS